jgi:hypothetical protein
MVTHYVLRLKFAYSSQPVPHIKSIFVKTWNICPGLIPIAMWSYFLVCSCIVYGNKTRIHVRITLLTRFCIIPVWTWIIGKLEWYNWGNLERNTNWKYMKHVQSSFFTNNGCFKVCSCLKPAWTVLMEIPIHWKALEVYFLMAHRHDHSLESSWIVLSNGNRWHDHSVESY